MKRRLAILGLLAASWTVAQAVNPISVTIDDPYQTAVQGQTTDLLFRGTITLDKDYYLYSFYLEYAELADDAGSIDTVFYSQSLMDFLGKTTPGATYQGDLFVCRVMPDKAAGDYLFSNALGPRANTVPEFAVYGFDGTNSYWAGAQYGITVREAGAPSVPGPAAVIPMAFGLAGVALRRRRLN